MGTCFLISISMGLLAKAAPQMNLLMLGFPIQITIAFVIMLGALPFIMEAFARVIEGSFNEILKFLENGSLQETAFGTVTGAAGV